MRRTLTVTTPASDLQLLTIDELREAAGVTGSDQDTRLRALGLRVAASIMAECNIAVGAGGEPTLLRETLTETIRNLAAPQLVLSRRHAVEIDSIVEDGVTLEASDYEVEPESGIVSRLCSDELVPWQARKVVVVYDAGFATVSGDLKQAAMDFMRLAWLESGRDPLVKSERKDIPGVMEREVSYWVGSVPGQTNEGAVPDVVSGQLKRFRNTAFG